MFSTSKAQIYEKGSKKRQIKFQVPGLSQYSSWVKVLCFTPLLVCVRWLQDPPVGRCPHHHLRHLLLPLPGQIRLVTASSFVLRHVTARANQSPPFPPLQVWGSLKPSSVCSSPSWPSPSDMRYKHLLICVLHFCAFRWAEPIRKENSTVRQFFWMFLVLILYDNR